MSEILEVRADGAGNGIRIGAGGQCGKVTPACAHYADSRCNQPTGHPGECGPWIVAAPTGDALLEAARRVVRAWENNEEPMTDTLGDAIEALRLVLRPRAGVTTPKEGA